MGKACNSNSPCKWWHDNAQLQEEVENFNIQEGFASQIGVTGAAEYCELVEEQKKRLIAIRKDADSEAKVIKNSNLSNVEKVKLLHELRSRQNSELKDVLLPHQIKRIKNMPFYNIVLYEEGFGNSVVNGFLAELLDLSIEERRAIKKKVEGVRKDYNEKLRKAQLDALREIRQSIPKEKGSRFDELIEPLLYGDRTLWPTNDTMFDTSRPTRQNARLKPIK